MSQLISPSEKSSPCPSKQPETDFQKFFYPPAINGTQILLKNCPLLLLTYRYIFLNDFEKLA